MRFAGFRRLMSARAAFRRDHEGVAAIEFSLILPFLVLACFGLAELCNAVENHRKVTLYARAVADLTGRSSVVSMDPIFSAAGTILQPFDASTVKIRVSAIGVQQKYTLGTIPTGLVGQVCSSVGSGIAPRAVKQQTNTNGIPDIPDVFKYDDAHYILAEVWMPYKPIIGSAIISKIFGESGLTFSQQIPWADRTDTEVVLPGGSKC